MKLIKIPARDFDLAKTLDSGQVFHWEKIGKGFVGTIGDLLVYVEQRETFCAKVRCGVTPSRIAAASASLELSRNISRLIIHLQKSVRRSRTIR